MPGPDADPGRATRAKRLAAENAELKTRLRELQDTLDSIHAGDVDALVVNGAIYTLESAHLASNRLRQDVLNQMEEAVFAFDAGEHLIYLNAAAERRYGVVSSEVLGRHKSDVFSEPGAAGATPAPQRAGVSTHRLPDGRVLHVEAIVSALSNAAGQPVGTLAVVRDVTALRDSEQRLRELNERLEATVQARTLELMTAEQALRQAQKMEAVGQLTGGIAHDFNNMLASISASLQVLQARLRQGRTEGLERYIAMGQESAKRAAALTQRLLAFARRQTLDPKPTDVNQLVNSMAELIRRTVGPDVELEVVGAVGLWPTRIDPSQLENSLLNLCINARDAMLPAGGRLTIETANKWLDERAAAARELAPGQYLSLCVSDTGAGMSPEVVKRVFDPFFTTKPLGQGTGLGLSMVYGFVRQSGGQVRIYSELGKGTTMCLYLPRFVGDAQQQELAHEPQEIESGDGETVLVIEDEPAIRVLIAEVLEEAGYGVLAVRDGAAGLKVLQSAARVDLLITDVGLPGGMNGRQVADAARVVRPQLKVLFITGYAENAAVGNGHLEHGMQILTKPFEIAVLAKKVRAMTAR
ncbi:MAG TPA: ATP-binding protein [Burkholderiaceae bacterium]|jgi:PAS domain S-box-containing protein